MADRQVVVVTGAMGQVGKRVVELLLARSAVVVALDLESPATRKVELQLASSTGRGEFIPAYVDITDAEAVSAVMRKHAPTAVVHLAAIVAPPCYRNPQLGRRVNVEGTANLVTAALDQSEPPLFLQASSSAVYGSRNPHRDPARLTAATPVNPVDCYGEDKVAAENIVADSGLSYAVLRLGGIVSPDTLTTSGPDYQVLTRALPRDGRIHAVDARDVGLAFANAVGARGDIDGKVLLIGGDESYVLLQRALEDDILAAVGIGRLGPSVGLPGDPGDDHGWGLTDWFDTTEAQTLLSFQEHSWKETLASLTQSVGVKGLLMRAAGPALRPLMRRQRSTLERREERGPYADPWALIGKTYGAEVLAPTTW